MAETFEIEVRTPDRTIAKGRAKSVRVPTEGGSIGILARHAALACTVDAGALEITREDGTEQVVFVGDGFLEMNDRSLKVLAEVGEEADSIDVERAERAVERARGRIDRRAEPDVDEARARIALTKALKRLAAAKRPRI